MPFSRTNNLCLLLFCIFQLSFSQNYPGKTHNATTGLPNNTVRSLFVDHKNTLWIGTDNGIVQKDNEVFKSFFEEDGIALNSCWAISEDKFENIWFGSYGGGISIFDGENFKVLSKKDGLVHNEITNLYPFKNFMFVGTSDGVSRVDIKNNEIKSWNYSATNDLFRVTSFFKFKNELYLTTYKTGIYRIKNDHEDLVLEKVNNHHFIYSTFPKGDSIYSNNKEFFTKSKIEDYLENRESIRNGSSIIWDQVETIKNRLFAAAWGIYDSSGGIYEIINDQMISRSADFNVPSSKVLSLAYDALLEKLYIGTMDAGLTEIDLNSKIKFHPAPNKSVLGFSKTNNSSALLYNDGLQITHTGKTLAISQTDFKQWESNYVLTTKLPLPKHEDSFYELNYTTPAKDIFFYDIKSENGQYWINSTIGIFAIDPSGKLDRYIPLHSEEINFTQEDELIETHPYGGVRIYKDMDLFRYEQFDQENPTTPTMVVNSLKTDDETYFLSVFTGLYKWKDGRFISYLRNGIWNEEKLRHITRYGQNLAISNEFGGIYVITEQPEFKILKKIPRAKIRGNTISFLSSYDKFLIIATEKGLTFLNENRQIFLDEEQGLKQPLLSSEISSDTLKIGTINGFYSLDPKKIINGKKWIYKLEVKGLYINNQNSSLDLSTKKEYKLDYDQNTITIKFGTNAHPFPNKLMYQYRLNDSEEWSRPFSEPEIYLPYLPYQAYNIAVKVTDYSNGTEYSQPLLRLNILPPFWKTWWFYLLILLLFTAIIVGFYQYEIRKNRKFEAQKSLIQKRFEETKMEALLAQMNPHFIFNAMNSIQNYIIDNDVENASTFLGDFARLIRLNLEYCTKPTILLNEEIEYLQSYIRVENTRFNNSVQVEFQVDPKIDTYEVEVPSMLLQTFIENVFVHAFPKTISNPTLKISFKKTPLGLECRIEDNGVEIQESRKTHTSKGMLLAKERLEFMGYDIDRTLQIKSSKNQGTLVILRLKD